jgi:hypothetical protein
MVLNKETALKILDCIDAIRREEENKPMGGESYELRCLCADIAKMAGFKTRVEWTGILLEDRNTLYYKDSGKDGVAFRC